MAEAHKELCGTGTARKASSPWRVCMRGARLLRICRHATGTNALVCSRRAA